VGGAGAVSGTGGLAGSAGGIARGGGAGVSGGAACDPWTPEHPEPCFEPCGGDPVGQWVQEEMCNRDAPGETAGCDSIHTGAGTADLALELTADGRVALAGTEQRSQTIVLSETCAVCPDAIAEPGLLAFREQGDRLFCNEVACGECYCSDPAGSNSFSEGFWLTDASILVLDSDYDYLALDYCVNGDEMWLGRADRGMSYRFRRTACGGKPLPCEERTAEECTLGSAEASCTLGHCAQLVPDDLNPCVGLEQSECALLSECAWDEGCGGVAWAECTFTSCDQPGCSWVPPDTPCTGEAVACTERTPQECVGEGCRPGTCAPPEGVEDGFLCERLLLCGVEGCTQTRDYDCIGTYQCADQVEGFTCERANCVWTTADGCEGTAIPCEMLDPSACMRQPGCALGTP
jgi:hypothetical protein